MGAPHSTPQKRIGTHGSPRASLVADGVEQSERSVHRAASLWMDPHVRRPSSTYPVGYNLLEHRGVVEPYETMAHLYGRAEVAEADVKPVVIRRREPKCVLVADSELTTPVDRCYGRRWQRSSECRQPVLQRSPPLHAKPGDAPCLSLDGFCDAKLISSNRLCPSQSFP